MDAGGVALELELASRTDRFAAGNACDSVPQAALRPRGEVVRRNDPIVDRGEDLRSLR